ncbi:MAG: hypothetical protein ACFIN2_00235 [Candidatus Walczuchella monophlebidarum]
MADRRTNGMRKKNQFLDDLERGITIKSHAIQMNYKGTDYILIDSRFFLISIAIHYVKY